MTSPLVSSSKSAAAFADADGRAQRRGGRPVVSDDDGKRARASAALTTRELAVVQRAARLRGERVSHFLRRAALEAAGQAVAAAPTLPPEWREVWTGLAPLAGNLNLITRHLNTAALNGAVAVSSSEWDELLRTLEALSSQISDLRRTLVPVE